MNGQVEGRLTLNFKVIRQDHVISFNIFEFCDLDLVETTPTLLFYHVYIKRYLD